MENKRYMNVQVDGYTRLCLTAIAILLTVVIIGLWAETTGPLNKTATARKYADEDAQQALNQGRWGTSSAPQQEMVKAQKEANTKLDELIQLLKNGEVKVQIVNGPVKTPGGDNVGKK